MQQVIGVYEPTRMKKGCDITKCRLYHILFSVT